MFYGEYVFLNIHRNTDGGDDRRHGRRPLHQRAVLERRAAALGLEAGAVHDSRRAKSRRRCSSPRSSSIRTTANRLLAGGLSLWRTNDAKTPNTPTSGPAWAAIKPSAGDRISAIAVAKGNGNIVWVGHADGQVFRTTNGTAASPIWQRVDQTGPSPLVAARYCTSITVDPRNRRSCMSTFGGYVTGNVWKTTDGGATWKDIGASLPQAPIRALAVHPRKTAFIYLGTEVGVFASEDAGATWSPTNEGPTNCSVDDLFWMGETLVSATHGRGMFKIDLSGVQ